jgi:hypothetical protein
MSLSFTKVLHSGNVLKVEYKNRWKWRPDGTWICFWWLSRQGCLVVLVPSMSIEDHPLWTCVSRDFVVVTTYPSKPNTLAIPLREKTTMHWEWEMMGVACTHPTISSGTA